MRHHANFRQNQANGFADIAIFRLSRWRPSFTLDLWGKFWDDPQRVLYKFSLYHCSKLDWNRFSSFDNTQV